jgi:hypothetical protein
VYIDGKPYDLGGHFCTDVYKNLKDLAAKLQLETENTVPTYIYDIHSKSTVSEDVDTRGYLTQTFRYLQIQRDQFPAMQGPCMYKYGAKLASVAKDWFSENDLKIIQSVIANTYTSMLYLTHG